MCVYLRNKSPVARGLILNLGLWPGVLVNREGNFSVYIANVVFTFSTPNMYTHVQLYVSFPFPSNVIANAFVCSHVCTYMCVPPHGARTVQCVKGSVHSTCAHVVKLYTYAAWRQHAARNCPPVVPIFSLPNVLYTTSFNTQLTIPSAILCVWFPGHEYKG